MEEKEKENVLERPKSITDKRKGLMISSIITFCLWLGFFIFAFVYLLNIFLSKDKNTQALEFVLFLVTIGWVSYIPALGLSIASICTSRFGLKSTDKKIKTTCLILLILSIILLVAVVFLGIVVAFFPTLLK